MKNKFRNLLVLPFVMFALVNAEAQTTVPAKERDSTINQNTIINETFQPGTASPVDTIKANRDAERAKALDNGTSYPNSHTAPGIHEPSGTLHNSPAVPYGTNPNSKVNPTGIYHDGTTNQNGEIVPVQRLLLDTTRTKTIQKDSIRSYEKRQPPGTNKLDTITQPERIAPPRPERLRKDTLK